MTFPWNRYIDLLTAEVLRVSAEELITFIGVTGGREFDDWMMVNATLQTIDHYSPFNTLLHGAARGLDTQAGHWAMRHRKTVRTLPARWRSLGNAAGPERNSAMLDILLTGRPHAALVSFPGSTGTADMTAKCNIAGLPVIDIQTILDQIQGY
jgi:hypothetical protein